MKLIVLFSLLIMMLGCDSKDPDKPSELILEGDLSIRECDFQWKQNLDTLKKQLKGAQLTELDSVSFTWEHIYIDTEITATISRKNVVYLTKADYDKYFGSINFKTLKDENIVYHVKLVGKKFEDFEWKTLKVISVEKRKGKTSREIC